MTESLEGFYIPPKKSVPKTFAIVSDKQLGDVVLLEPVTRLLAGLSGQPCALDVKPSFEPLVQLMTQACWGPCSGRINDQSWTTSWSSRAVIRSRRVASRQRLLLCNRPDHVRWWYRFLFKRIVVEPIEGEYWAHYFWRAMGGDPALFRAPQLQKPPSSWAHSRLPEGPYVLLHPTASRPEKYWLPQAWQEVLSSALASGLPIVLTGGDSPAERAHCDALLADPKLAARCINLAGDTSLRQYLHAVSRASLLLCVDGSASHLAQAFGVQSLTLFGPVHPVKWHWPSLRHRVLSAYDYSSAVDQVRTEDIPVSVVQAELDLLLNSKA